MASLLNKTTIFGQKPTDRYVDTKDGLPSSNIPPLPRENFGSEGVVAPKPYSLTIYFDSSASPSPGGWDNPTLACAGTGTPLTVYAFSSVPLFSLRQAFNDGLRLCLDEALTSPLVGGDKWFKDAQFIGGEYMSVGNDGFIALMGVCPSPSPSPSCTPSLTPSISITPSRTCTPTVTPSITRTPTVTPTISISPSITPTITPSVTPSPQICSLTLYFDVAASPSPGGWDNPTLACAGTGTPLTVYFSAFQGGGCPTSFQDVYLNGKALYTNSTLTTVLVGGDKWFKDSSFGDGNYMNIGNDGFIAQFGPCPAPSPTPTRSVSVTRTPTVTPSVTRTPIASPSVTPSISITPTRTPSVTPSPVPCSLTLYFNVAASPSPGGWDTSTLACEGTGTPLTVYFSGPFCPTSFYEAFSSGKAIYTNSALTTVLVGGDKWFKDAQLGTGNYMSVGNDGFIAQFSPCPGATPLPTPTPTISVTPSTTPSISISTTVTPTVTPSNTLAVSPSVTPSVTITPSLTPTPSSGSLSSFITVWETTNSGSSNSNQITLPLQSDGTYNFSVNWGDGNTDTITTYNQAETIHTYSSPGEYTVTITGTCSGFAFQNTKDRQKILRVVRWGNVNLGDGINVGNNLNDGVFHGCTNLNLSSVEDVPNLSSMTTMRNMFRNCTSLTTINNVNSWNVSTITSMEGTFRGATNFNQSLNSWNVSNVVNMGNMFNGATNFNGNITSWNVSDVTSMIAMFSSAVAFNQSIGSWDVSNVTNMAQMFKGSPFSTPKSNFNQNIGSWNVGNVTDMRDMFQLAENFNQNLNSWDVSKVTNMSQMFNGAINFNGNISSWNVGSVTLMNDMFEAATNFNQNIGGWNVSNVTNMANMFNSATNFNQNIGNWNVSKVTNMDAMFSSATNFNQNIGSWNVSNVTNFNFSLPSPQFMGSKTAENFSAANLDAIYNGWGSRSVKPNISIGFGNIKYTSAGQSGKNVLTGAPNNWTILDGGI